MSYRLTPTAERDLREILQYIAEEDGIDRALHVHEKFVEAFELIGTSPGVGRLREDLTGATVRWTVFKFVLIYESQRSSVVILRVLHDCSTTRNCGTASAQSLRKETTKQGTATSSPLSWPSMPG